ncbi:MAG: transposase [Anaerolineae bacterium]|nr:transposase [Anaerolineae bacterium]
MTDLDAKSALRIYRCRMKIEQAFRDLKNKLGMQGRMSKRQSYMGEV